MTAAAGSAAIIPCAEAAGVGTQGPTASRHGSLQILGSFIYEVQAITSGQDRSATSHWPFQIVHQVFCQAALVSVSNCSPGFLYGTVWQ